VEDDLPPGGRLEDILTALRNEAPPAEDDGGKTIDLEEFADHIHENDPFFHAAASGIDL